MDTSIDYRTGRHCLFNLNLHLVFAAKYRRLVFTKEILEDLRTIFSNVCRDFEATLEEFDGEHDHGHLLITYPPKLATSRLVNSRKASRPGRSEKSTIRALSGRYGVRAFGLPVILLGSRGVFPP